MARTTSGGDAPPASPAIIIAGYVAACRALAGADQRQASAALRLPTMVIAGEADRASPPDVVR
ncbi:MAG: hypothetical protein ACO1OA_09550, partial [Paracoccus marcusii]